MCIQSNRRSLKHAQLAMIVVMTVKVEIGRQKKLDESVKKSAARERERRRKNERKRKKYLIISFFSSNLTGRKKKTKM